ncbi:testis-expressed protein 13D-like [Canis lupus baileyi]|uniref:testis-expressed protein 13D-like n=1 Tax=Canis lupus familiaris TaxID=9615 RepID=UPI0018F7D59A|nr:testis-expressed protein 13D-like [Canis lupus familiaris]
MAVDFGDHASGFRHAEVVRFINNEVLLNGGGPEFYAALRSRPWSEVEDRLRGVLADPRVPRAHQRACAWSALALGVRGAARQREQQGRRIRRLQEQMEERETAAWALASELQRMRGERKEMAAQLRCARAALQQVSNERNVLRRRLIQAEKSALADKPPQEVMSESRAKQRGARAWPVDVDEQCKMMAAGAQAVQPSEGQMAAPAAAPEAAPATVLRVQAPPSSWAQVMQSSLPVQVSHAFPFSASFPMGFPYSASLPHSLVVEADAAAAATTAAPVGSPQMPPLVPPGPWAAVRAQKQMVPLCDQRCYDQEEYSEIPQGGFPLRGSRSHSQEEGPVCLQGMASLEIGNHSQKENLERPQGTAPRRDRNSSQKKRPVMPQKKYSPENSKNHSQEDPERPQGTSPLRSSRSSGARKSPKKQHSQGQKAKQPKGEKASDSQHQGKPASVCSPKNWDCPWCKAINFSWRKACYKCKKVCVAGESRGLDPVQTH